MSNWLWQTVLAGAVMVPTGTILLLTMGGDYDGLPGLVGYVVVPAVLSFALITAVSIIGIPLRLLRGWRTWWRARPWIALGLAALGIAYIVAARILATTVVWVGDSGDTNESYVPQPLLLIAGAVSLAFGLVHTWLGREPDNSGLVRSVQVTR